jgi:hypothetical protein
MFPAIYNICNEQDISVASAAGLDWNFIFRRWMTHDLAKEEPFSGLKYRTKI